MIQDSEVPILDRPEERSQCRSRSRSAVDEFQSSIAPKNDRNDQIALWRFIPVVPILDRPEERSQ